jgi:Tfp pilus assembly protein PilO
MNDIQMLVTVPQLIIGLLIIAAVVGMAWWSLREDK